MRQNSPHGRSYQVRYSISTQRLQTNRTRVPYRNEMHLNRELELTLTRRQLFGLASRGIGVAALASLLEPSLFADDKSGRDPRTGGLIGLPHFAPKAKRV